MDKAYPNRDGEPQSFHSFLMALKGKTVTIYRGGPESKTGRLLDVKPDYVALHAQNNNNKNNNKDQNQDQNQDNNKQNTVVYYQVQHVKSIIEDTKSNSMQQMEANGDEVDFHDAENFTGLFEQLTTETIQINQGGPESKSGILVGLSGDFIVLFTEDDGIVYINLEHVKSVSKHTKNVENEEIQEIFEIPEWVKAERFQDVFSSFSHQWVSINRGGPEAMEGVLVENVGGHYTLVNNQEVMRIHPFHIKSISCGPKGFLKQNKQNEKNNENKNDEMVEEECVESSSSSSSDEKRSSRCRRSSSSSSSSSCRRSSSSSRRSSSSSSRRSSRCRSHRETVVKTIDYTWKG
ncbi:MAG: spore coat protein CotH [Bacillota bacterium]|nr:spore coat protein CotH [Bacillota bacterium]